MRTLLFPSLLLAAFMAAVFAPAAGAEDGYPAFSPETAAQTERARTKYQEIATNGGWPMLPPMRRVRTRARGPV